MDHQEGKTKQNWRPMEINTCTSQKLEGSFVYSSEPNTLHTWTCAFPSTISSVQNIQLDVFVSRSWSVPTVMLVKGGTGSTDCCWLVTHSICNITQFELCTIEGCPYEWSSKQRYECLTHGAHSFWIVRKCKALMLMVSDLVGYSSGQFVHSGSSLCNLLGSIDDIRWVLQWAFSPASTQTNYYITTESAQHASSFLSASMKARQSVTHTLKKQMEREIKGSWNF